MVEGWLQGRLDLPLPVPEGLLKLPDPHDPLANKDYRYAGEFGIHDLSLYNDRLYMYWGPTPALVAFLPWRLLTGTGLSTAGSIWAFTVVGWLFSALFMLHVIRRFFPATGSIVCFSALLVVGLGNFAAVVLQRPTVYEVSIAAAYAFTSLAWWQLAVALWRPPDLRGRPLALASLAFGLAVASRPSWIVASPVLLVALWDIRHEWRGPLFRTLAGHLIVPITGCVLVLLLLNDVRFGDPLEFGTQYQLSAERPSSEPFALQHIPFSLYMYLLAPAATTDYFPFLLPSIAPSLPVGNRGTEGAFGLFLLLPVLALVALTPMALCFRGLCMLAVMLTAGFTSMLGVLAMLNGVAMRYELDFAPMLALLSAVGFLLGEDRWRGTASRRWIFRSVWSAMLVASFTMTFFAACSRPPGRSSPAIALIALWANTIALHVGWSPESFIERLEIEMMLPVNIEPQKEQVVVGTGQSPYHNITYVRRPDAGHVVAGFHRGDLERVESDPMAIDETVPHTMLLELGSFYPPVEHPYWSGIGDEEMERLRSLIRVSLDDRIMIDGNWQQWSPTSSTPVYGDLPGGSRGQLLFTGKFLQGFQHEVPLK
jgi:hypothetical protein